MPQTLARKIRRIGIMPSTVTTEGKSVRKFEKLTVAERESRVATLRAEAKEKRILAKLSQATPAKPHRRSKSRKKATK